MLETNPIDLFKSSFPRFHQLFALLICGLFLSAPATHAQSRFPPKVEDFSESTLVISAAKYLGTTAESMAEIMDRVFSQYGIPEAIIRGEEVSRRGVWPAIWPWNAGNAQWLAAPDLLAGASRASIRAAMPPKALRLFTAFRMLRRFTVALAVLTGRPFILAAWRSIIYNAMKSSWHQCAPALASEPVSASDI